MFCYIFKFIGTIDTVGPKGYYKNWDRTWGGCSKRGKNRSRSKTKSSLDGSFGNLFIQGSENRSDSCPARISPCETDSAGLSPVNQTSSSSTTGSDSGSDSEVLASWRTSRWSLCLETIVSYNFVSTVWTNTAALFAPVGRVLATCFAAIFALGAFFRKFFSTSHAPSKNQHSKSRHAYTIHVLPLPHTLRHASTLSSSG